ncbi:MAG: hypothetical protein WCL14_09770 [Bacteroidota bacterium]
MIKINRQNQPSFIVMILICLILIFFNLSFPPGNIISWDFFGYYLYLPFTFIYHDLGFKNQEIIHEIIDKYHNTASIYQIFISPNGEWIDKYPIGIAILNIPFFFIGHLWAISSNYPLDGFSHPYQYSIFIGTIFYTVVGVYFLRKLLLQFLNERTTIVTSLIVVFGTNYFFHTSFDGTGAMPHNYLFTLYVIIVWSTVRWHQDFKLKHGIILSIVIGLSIISRGSEIICLIIPLFWGIKNKVTLIQKIHIVKKYYLQIILFTIIIIIICYPQLAYWKKYAGRYLFNSYGNNAGEGFEFLHPFIFQFLFSFRKGWFIYTPIMIFAFIGFLNLFIKNRSIFLPLAMFIFAGIFFASSWSCWWYAESFSQRSVIQYYPILALPLGYFLQYIIERKFIIKLFCMLFFSIFIVINLFQTYQYKKGIIHGSRMTKEYYFSIFGNVSKDESLEKLLLINRTFDGKESFKNEVDYTNKTISNLDFENINDNKNLSDSIFHTGHHSYVMDSVIEFSPSIRCAYDQITKKPFAWIRASAYIYSSTDLKENPVSMVICFNHKGFAYKYSSFDLGKMNFETNKWNKFSFDYLTPEVRRTSDELQVYIWHRGKKAICIDDFKVEAFEQKK